MNRVLLLLSGVVLATALNTEDDLCPDSKKNITMEKTVDKLWHLAYIFPTSPPATFFQKDKCIQVKINFYPLVNQFSATLWGVDKLNKSIELDTAFYSVKGAQGIGNIDGFTDIFTFIDVDYDHWIVGKNCYLKGDNLVEELWWVFTGAADGSLGPKESAAAFNEALLLHGLTRFFTEQHSTHLEQCSWPGPAP